jgi:hypothetical protein
MQIKPLTLKKIKIIILIITYQQYPNLTTQNFKRTPIKYFSFVLEKMTFRYCFNPFIARLAISWNELEPNRL